MARELTLVVTPGAGRGYRMQAFDGFPNELAAAKPLPGLNDLAFHPEAWLPFQAGDSELMQKLEPWLRECSVVRFCYDPRAWELGQIPLERFFSVEPFNLPVIRHPLSDAGELVTPYAGEVAVPGMLRVLLVYANPDRERFPPRTGGPEHLPHLKEHFTILEQALNGLVFQQLVAFETLDNEDGRLTADQVLGRIHEFNPHVFVYVGHGYPARLYDGGLHWGDRETENLPFGALRSALAKMNEAETPEERPAMRMLVLAAAHSGAAHLVGVPAVIGMDQKFPAPSVATFLKPFIEAVCARESIEVAYRGTLRELWESDAGAGEFPRLWLTTPHGRLFPHR